MLPILSLFCFIALMRLVKDSHLSGACISMTARQNRTLSATVCPHVFIILCTFFFFFPSAASLAGECFRTSDPFTYEVVPVHFLQLSRQRLSVRGN